MSANVQCPRCFKWECHPTQLRLDGSVVADWYQVTCPVYGNTFFCHRLYRGNPPLVAEQS